MPQAAFGMQLVVHMRTLCSRLNHGCPYHTNHCHACASAAGTDGCRRLEAARLLAQ